ncbi:MAG TPA: hypothetical protein VK741_23705 [Acetobacteraceae bacterium]|nr:hypothetical protein [Acetobacteraceae bacterium]
MRTDWPDPDDLRPSAARTARRIQGWRTYCPLRRMLANPHAGISAAHIHAADKLRELYDLAQHGYSSGGDLQAVHVAPAPRAGLSDAEMARGGAARSLTRAMAGYTLDETLLLAAIVLLNHSLSVWARAASERTGTRCTVRGERIRLIGLLDRLAQHFDAEVDFEVRAGWRLPL